MHWKFHKECIESSESTLRVVVLAIQYYKYTIAASYFVRLMYWDKLHNTRRPMLIQLDLKLL